MEKIFINILLLGALSLLRERVEISISDTIFKTFFSFKSNQISISYSVFHADSEYNIFKKFSKRVVYMTFGVIQLI